MAVKIEGLQALVTGLDKRQDLEPIKHIIKFDTQALESKMKSQTYSSFRKGYTEGDTRDSIHLTIKDGGMTGEVEPGTKYSKYVEYGTRYMEAEPFVKPSFNAVAQAFKGHIEKIMR